jgi:molybdate transport system substrate-binding protein
MMTNQKKLPAQNRLKRSAAIILAMALLLLVPSVFATEILVSAAASLNNVLTELGTNFQAHTGIQVEFNFDASSALARQIVAGAPADIFFSADETQMDKLAEKNLIDPSTRVSRLGNSLVVVEPKDSTLPISSASDLTNADVKQIALADPKAVPAGVYAKAWLTKLDLWPVIEPKVVPAENVRAALAAVASGNADAGVVYKTDAAISKKVKVAYEVPVAEGPKISYPMALVKGSAQPDAAKKFLAYLSSEEAGQVFLRYGFLVK